MITIEKNMKINNVLIILIVLFEYDFMIERIFIFF